jgi:hypothetical protein
MSAFAALAKLIANAWIAGKAPDARCMAIASRLTSEWLLPRVLRARSLKLVSGCSTKVQHPARRASTENELLRSSTCGNDRSRPPCDSLTPRGSSLTPSTIVRGGHAAFADDPPRSQPVVEYRCTSDQADAPAPYRGRRTRAGRAALRADPTRRGGSSIRPQPLLDASLTNGASYRRYTFSCCRSTNPQSICSEPSRPT